jgi:hypothetical protein
MVEPMLALIVVLLVSVAAKALGTTAKAARAEMPTLAAATCSLVTFFMGFYSLQLIFHYLTIHA